MKISKREKEFKKLLHKKTLSSEEAIRLLELDGWVPDKDNRSRGSHNYFSHPTKKGKNCVPIGRKTLPKDTKDSILEIAGLLGD